ALSLGMTTWTALRRVVVPQAIRIVIPPVTNDFIALFKDTSVVSMISVIELTGEYRYLINNHPQLMLEFGLLTAGLYLLMSYPLSLVARRMETRFKAVARELGFTTRACSAASPYDFRSQPNQRPRPLARAS